MAGAALEGTAAGVALAEVGAVTASAVMAGFTYYRLYSLEVAAGTILTAEIASGLPVNPVSGLGGVGSVAAQAGCAAINRADAVIAETLAGKGNITSQYTLIADELLNAGMDFLGEGYKEIGKAGSGVFRSLDGLRQFRIDKNSLLGNHEPGIPHGHLEVYAPGAKKFTTNNHIPFNN